MEEVEATAGTKHSSRIQAYLWVKHGSVLPYKTCVWSHMHERLLRVYEKNQDTDVRAGKAAASGPDLFKYFPLSMPLNTSPLLPLAFLHSLNFWISSLYLDSPGTKREAHVDFTDFPEPQWLTDHTR